MSGTAVYAGLLASTWDVWRDDTRGWSDRALYLKCIERYGQPVLDLGCGTGRLWLDYRALGIDVDGLDNSPEMLDICRRKAAAGGVPARAIESGLFLQDLERFELPRRYRSIIAASSVLQLVSERAAAQELVRRLFAQLEPGGMLIGSFDTPWQPGAPLEDGWGVLFEKPRPSDGAVVTCRERQWYDPARQLWHTEQHFEVTLGGIPIETERQRRSPEGRWYTHSEGIELYRQAGFAEIRALEGFSEEPAKPDARLFCVLGVKPSA